MVAHMGSWMDRCASLFLSIGQVRSDCYVVRDGKLRSENYEMMNEMMR